MENNIKRPGIDNKYVAKILLSGENMGNVEKNFVFDIATKYTSDLADEKIGDQPSYLQKSQDVKNHFSVIVLDRIVSLYQNGSTSMFDKLKNTICSSLLIKEDNLSDERLYTVLSSSLDDYFGEEINDEIRNNMEFIRKNVEIVVPTKVDLS